MALSDWWKKLIPPKSNDPGLREGAVAKPSIPKAVPTPPTSRGETPRSDRPQKPKSISWRDNPEAFGVEHPTPTLKSRKVGFEYLGPNLSFRLHETRGNDQRLAELGLPHIETPEALAELIGYSSKQIRWLAYHSNEQRSCHYVHFEIPKSNGGTRTLAAPRPAMAACQRWILSNILGVLSPSDHAHGFVHGRSIATGAALHVNRECLVQLDLKDFFPSITFVRVQGLFISFGYSPRVATVLASLCTESPRQKIVDSSGNRWVAVADKCLPQGACTSPAISNLICRSMDARLQGVCKVLGWTYSRYADDLTFSASGEPGTKIGYLLHRVRGIVHDESFIINELKTRVRRKSDQQRVTGLIVNDKIGVPRKTVRKLRAILHQAQYSDLESQNRGRTEGQFQHWVQGMIGFVHMAAPEKGLKLLSALQKIKDP